MNNQQPNMMTQGLLDLLMTNMDEFHVKLSQRYYRPDLKSLAFAKAFADKLLDPQSDLVKLRKFGHSGLRTTSKV